MPFDIARRCHLRQSKKCRLFCGNARERNQKLQSRVQTKKHAHHRAQEKFQKVKLNLLKESGLFAEILSQQSSPVRVQR